MDKFVDNNMQTLTDRVFRKASLHFNESIIGKEEIGLLLSKLTSVSNFAELIINNEDSLSTVNGSTMHVNLRDTHIRIDELYRYVNQLNTFLDSSAAILGSSIASLESEIAAMEKMIDNYSFLLADEGAYNFAFLESFHNDLNRDSFNFALTDRNNSMFSDGEQAIINLQEGTLSLVGVANSYPLTGQVIKSNVGSFVDNSSEVKDALHPSLDRGWRMTVATPGPVNTGLKEAGNNVGAQVLLEFILSQASPSSQITLQPFSDHNLEIVQIKIFTDIHDQTGTNVLAEPMSINRLFTFNFPITFVYKFQILVNQPTYVKKLINDRRIENDYDELKQSIIKKTNNHKLDRFSDRRGGKNISVFNLLQSLSKAPKPRHAAWVDNKDVRLPEFQKWTQLYRSKSEPLALNGTHDKKNTIDQKMSELAWRTNRQLLQPFAYRDLLDQKFTNTSTNLPNISLTLPTQTQQPLVHVDVEQIKPDVNKHAYRYSLGFRYIGIGVDVQNFKGVHVSRPLQSDGEIGVVRIRTSETNGFLDTFDRDISLATSIEYSISNVSRPINETDWIPILPIGASKIEGERLFFDLNGHGLFRFRAARNENIDLYKNGKIVNIDSVSTYLYTNDFLAVQGLNLPGGTFSNSDIFTVSYTPAEDNTSIDLFAIKGVRLPPLVSAHSDDGGGEEVLATGDRNIVALQYFPYIDYNQVATSTYTTAHGMSPYAPVLVRLSDGAEAVNLTNYTAPLNVATSNDIPTLPPATAGIFFYHSGNNLIFNQPVTQKFRVFYQYLENTVRVRTVLRVNNAQFVSPKVDYWHLKAKTRRADKGAIL